MRNMRNMRQLPSATAIDIPAHSVNVAGLTLAVLPCMYVHVAKGYNPRLKPSPRKITVSKQDVSSFATFLLHMPAR